MNGSIDFFCCPEFDAPTVFASILDDREGGRFQIAPVLDDIRHKQLYLPETNILLTRFLSSEGVAEVSDFMPVVQHGLRTLNRVNRPIVLLRWSPYVVRCLTNG